MEQVPVGMALIVVGMIASAVAGVSTLFGP